LTTCRSAKRTAALAFLSLSLMGSKLTAEFVVPISSATVKLRPLSSSLDATSSHPLPDPRTRLNLAAGAASTGFEDPSYASSLGNQVGARVENVRLMAELSKAYNPNIGIKPAGGIRSVSQVMELLEASGRPLDPRLFRVGTSSARRIWEELQRTSQSI